MSLQRLHGVPEGAEAIILIARAREADGPILHVARDDVRAARIAEATGHFDPCLPIIRLPAWDCAPYDRASPHPDIMAERMAALKAIGDGIAGPALVLTTIAGITQRLPPADYIRANSLELTRGDRREPEQVIERLEQIGFDRVATVQEPGEYAVRGGLVDLWPAGAQTPARLDFFGDEIETIRPFDPISQRTQGMLEAVSILPAGEFLLDEATRSRFRTGYRQAFGAIGPDDPLYQAIGEGRRYPGAEHWLPLYHDRLTLLTDWLPAAPISLDPNIEAAAEARFEQVRELYEARRLDPRERGGAPYHALEPARLYLDGAGWQTVLAAREVTAFATAAAPEDARDAGGRPVPGFHEVRTDPNRRLFPEVADFVKSHHRAGRRVLVAAYSGGSRERLGNLLAEEGLGEAEMDIAVLGIERGFILPDLAVLTEQDILGERVSRPQTRRRKRDAFQIDPGSLAIGDLVVHADHGVGRFDGLEAVSAGGAAHDCVRVLYAGDDRLFLPVENLDLLTRYGSEEGIAQLDKLGGAGWQARKAKVKKKLLEMADELIRLAAARQTRTGERMPAPEGLWQEFCARFPFPETEDQLRAIEEVMADLDSGRPMDRLICGDVGFGKTEVAMRAAFAAALSGRQVAVVTPTTLLARQHALTFARRFEGMPVRIGQLSRLVPAKAQKQLREELGEGRIDIVIGTHAILSDQTRFRNLGLIIVDEEQHFGVKQKERLKALREDVHVLTLTATPIPRTLQMSLTGVRDLSLITTPPVDRLAVRTFVIPYDPVMVREALLREHRRGGQSFYVCPRIEDLAKIEQRLTNLVPDLRYVTAHGKMSASELEERMGAFDEGAFDVLLATNIIESGLDIPRANTMIIHRADLFGLAQLYQLRGRIGRSKERGYAYFTYSAGKVLNRTAEKRLHVIEMLDTLGAGFQLASYDLDIRGAGNLLGEQQSGHVKEVGVELYQQLLEEAVAERKAGEGAPPPADWTPQIQLGEPVLIPEAYVADLDVRLGLYRRLADLVEAEEFDAFAAELKDRFGPPPPEVENLLDIMGIKQACRAAGVARLDAGPKGAILTLHESFTAIDPLIAWVGAKAGTVKLKPDGKLVTVREWTDRRKRFKGVRGLLKELATLQAASAASSSTSNAALSSAPTIR